MIVVVAVDDRNGMTFNHRRLSQDRILRKWILQQALRDDRHVWMNAYTRMLFATPTPEEECRLISDENFLANAPAGDICYVENMDVRPFEDRIEEVWLCLWNRRYPADTYWELDMSGWSLLCEEEFAGSSHDKITIQRLRRSGTGS